jgi:hypothetical protein
MDPLLEDWLGGVSMVEGGCSVDGVSLDNDSLDGDPGPLVAGGTSVTRRQAVPLL